MGSMLSLVKVCCLVVFCLSTTICATHADRSERSTSVTTIKPNANSHTSLHAYYRNLEAQFLKKGYLRSDAGARGINWDKNTLIRNFKQIAMYREYGGKSGFHAMQTESVLRRWQDPVRISTIYGKSIGPQLKKNFSHEIGHTVSMIRKATGHKINFTNKNPNLFVIVVNDQERRNLRPFLNKIAPGLGRSGSRAILKMPKNVMCMVIAHPYADPRRGYKNAMIIVRAEHTPRMRRSCIQEEMAQAMGLPNDSDGAKPSIFNDNEEFGVLTDHDMMLLRILYDHRLKPGMTLKQVTPVLPAITKATLSR